MTAPACSREDDVLDAVRLGREPAGLREHAEDCPVCADLWQVALALSSERDEAWSEARVPTSAQVWWRATMRARAEGAATAARPIALLQVVAAAGGAALCALVALALWPAVWEPVAGMAARAARGESAVYGLALNAAVQQTLWSIGAAALAGLVLAPVVLYLALADE